MSSMSALTFVHNPSDKPHREGHYSVAALHRSVSSLAFPIISALNRYLYTALLFTWTDYKTIFFPITAFACATAPVHSISKLVQGWLWIWIHLLLCNVSNQARSKNEDAINRPWRPLPSGRITEVQAVWMRYVTAVICLCWSAYYGRYLLLATTGLIVTTFLYDEAGFAGHVIGKNFCNIGGYTAFEVGATSLMGNAFGLDTTAVNAVLLSGLLIFTTIQAQDFSDVEGDAAIGRVTFPIYAPEFSRAFTLAAMLAWSIGLGWFWGIGTASRVALSVLGTYIGLRFYLWRTPEADKRSYLIFNAWLMLVHVLPIHARTGILDTAIMDTLSQLPATIGLTGLPPTYVGLGVLFILVIVRLFRRSSIRDLPVPGDVSWPWGHEKTVFMNEPGVAFKVWMKDLGSTFRIKAALGLILGDPDGIAHILQKRVYDYHHSKVVRPRIGRLLGKGLGWIEGEQEHKRMRKMLTPSVSPENIKNMADDVREAGSIVVNELMHTIQTKEGRNTVDILDWMNRAALNAFGRAIFGHDFEAGNSKHAQAILHARHVGISPVARYFGFVTQMLLRRFPSLNHLPLPMVKAQGLVRIAIQSGVARTMLENANSMEKGEANGRTKDVLSRLLAAHADGSIPLSEVYDQISTFIISGYETTGEALAYTMWELSRNPDVERKLRAELETFGRDPNYDDYNSRLPYLDATLREVLRKYPGLPYMERIATQPDAIPLRHPIKTADGKVLNEINIQPGQTVLIPIMSIHRSDAMWDNPDQFNPDRWLSELPNAEDLCSGWSNLLAFSDGPRTCIGSRLGIFQYKVILTAMLKKFRFHDSGASITFKVSSSLQPWVNGEPEKGPQLPLNLELI
ncbi:hypothetical protein HGRIS_014587 [Hohenbuehelia grisea]|uniref:Cytochrome P450 n=1 Tax=Hohenbuehelia grisea TaxID=104357 RepID=A0ABR3JU32_9AGAR